MCVEFSLMVTRLAFWNKNQSSEEEYSKIIRLADIGIGLKIDWGDRTGHDETSKNFVLFK